DLLEAPYNEQVAIAIQESLVTRPEPTICEGVSVCGRIVIIAPEDARAAHNDFAPCTHWEYSALGVHNGDFRPRCHSHRSGLALARWQRIVGDITGGLRHPVDANHRSMEYLF